MTWFIEMVREVSAAEAALAELQREKQALAQAEAAHAAFLDRYYTRILPLTERLATLQRRLKTTEAGVAADVPVIKPRRPGAPLEAEIKTLYRALVKTCHPDHHHGAPSPIFSEIQQAYRTGDVARLWRLHLRDRLRLQETAEKARACLAEERGRIEALRRDLRRRASALEESATGRLCRYASELQADGIDHVAVTASRIERKIAAARLILWQRSIRVAIGAANAENDHVPRPHVLTHLSA